MMVIIRCLLGMVTSYEDELGICDNYNDQNSDHLRIMKSDSLGAFIARGSHKQI